MSGNARIARLTGTLVALMLCAGSALAQTPRPAGWTEESHGNEAPANYALVLPDDRVNEITIVFRAEDWAATLANMTALLGEHGEETEFMRAIAGLFGQGREVRSCAEDVEQEFGRALVRDHGVNQQALIDAAPLADEEPAAFAEAIGVAPAVLKRVWLEVSNRCTGGPARALATLPGNAFSVPNPDWFPVGIRFGRQVWPEVGFRYKGNSSLSFGWGTGRLDLPIKLDFDEFEDDHPELNNQRFHGFKQLTFANNFQDTSLLREKLTADIFRAAGVPAAETAYYLVYLDRGDGAGAQLLGLYTAVELPDDTLIETQFADDNGNMYKPDGAGATFAAGSFDEASFDKESNKSSGYEDVLALFAALHAGARRSDPAAWRAGLEAVFYVDGFLRWLATNQLIQSWDAYGATPHNYYLYADAARGGALTWIPWDHNLALSPGLGRSGTGGFGRPRTLSLDEVGAEWPLIRFLLDDVVYAARYRELVAEVAAGAFSVERMSAIYDANVALLTEVLTRVGDEAGLAGVRVGRETLQAHLERRARAAAEWLAQNSS